MLQVVLDPATITSRQEFARALTALRETAGLTVREVARTTGIRASTAGGYFSGRHLPPISSTAVLPELLAACGVTDAAELDAWQEAFLRVRRTPAQRPAPP